MFKFLNQIKSNSTNLLFQCFSHYRISSISIALFQHIYFIIYFIKNVKKKPQMRKQLRFHQAISNQTFLIQRFKEAVPKGCNCHDHRHLLKSAVQVMRKHFPYMFKRIWILTQTSTITRY